MCQRKGTIAAIALSSLSLVLFVVNAWTVVDTQRLQAVANDRQNVINEGLQLSTLNTQLVRALGTAVIAKNDTKVKDLLSANGITVTADKNAKKPAAAPAAAPAAK